MANKPMKYRRRERSPITRYARHLSSKDAQASKRALTLLYTLACAGALRARNARQLTFVFAEVEDLISEEDSNFLEVRGHVTACRTAQVAGEPVVNVWGSLEELLKEWNRFTKVLKECHTNSGLPSCAFYFRAQSDLPPLHGEIDTWETDNT